MKNNERFELRLPRDLKQKLDLYAEKHGLRSSLIIRKLINDLLTTTQNK